MCRKIFATQDARQFILSHVIVWTSMHPSPTLNMPPPFTYQVISGYCTVPRAIQITSSTVSVQALYARIARYKIRDGRMQDVERNTNASNASNASMRKSPPELTAPQPSLVTRSRAHEHKRTKVYKNALNALPIWSDRSKSSDAFLKKKRRTPGQCAQAQFKANADQAF